MIRPLLISAAVAGSRAGQHAIAAIRCHPHPSEDRLTRAERHTPLELRWALGAVNFFLGFCTAVPHPVPASTHASAPPGLSLPVAGAQPCAQRLHFGDQGREGTGR